MDLRLSFSLPNKLISFPLLAQNLAWIKKKKKKKNCFWGVGIHGYAITLFAISIDLTSVTCSILHNLHCMFCFKALYIPKL